MLPETIEKWKSSTKRLSIGISITTVLLLLYNIALFLPDNWTHKHGTDTGPLVLVLGLAILILALAYLAITNYTRGLSRFATNFDTGGKRALWMTRWSFILYLAGIVLQVIVFKVVAMNVASLGQLLLGNILLLASDVLGVVGFLSLATVENMTSEGRKGAVNMVWAIVLLFVGSCLTSWVLQSHSPIRVIWKFFGLIVNILAAVAFFKNWKRIITDPDTVLANHQAMQQEKISTPTPADGKSAEKKEAADTAAGEVAPK